MVRELPTSPCTPSPRPAVGWEAASRAGADPDSSDSQPRAPQGYSWPSHTAPSCCQAWYVPIGPMENKSSAPTWLRDQRRGEQSPFSDTRYQLPPRPLPAPCPAAWQGQRVWLWEQLQGMSLPAAWALGHAKPPPKLQAAALRSKAMPSLPLDTREIRDGLLQGAELGLLLQLCSSLCWPHPCPSPLGHPRGAAVTVEQLF